MGCGTKGAEVNAIPTKYEGVQFRSRLEAKWAAFFDLLGWKWEYEPLDLKGYIPDFILLFKEPLLIEVKPFIDLNDQVIREAEDKIEASGWPWQKVPPMRQLHQVWRTDQEQREADYVGAVLEFPPREPCPLDDHGGDLAVEYRPRPMSFDAWFSFEREKYRQESIVVGSLLPPPWHGACEPEALRIGSNYRFHFRDCRCGIGVIDVEGFFACKRCGQYDGGHTPLANFRTVSRLWREAGNSVQWRAPR